MFECVAILDILKGNLGEENHLKYYSILEELSKMLSGLINSHK